MKPYHFFAWMAGCLLLMAVSGCSGGGDGGDSTGEGSLSLYLTDAATDSYQAVYVTIDEVRVHRGAEPEEDENEDGEEEIDTSQGWQVVASPGKTYNLMELVNGVLTRLGVADLESGTYTQMRLMLGSQPDTGINLLGQAHPYPHYIIDSEDAVHELKVPSGYQTGIKLVHSFDIVNGVTLELILDFDAAKSVVQAGKSGNYNLKPTIKVIGTVNRALVKGVVTDAQGNPLAGAFVSAQIPDPDAADPADRVAVAASTVTEDTGAYQLFLAPGAYLIVAYKGAVTDYGAAYGPECVGLAVVADAEYTRNLALADRPSGHVVADITTGGQIAAVSFRQLAPCGSGMEEIEVTSLQVSEDDLYTIRLPGGIAVPLDYSAVAFTAEQTAAGPVSVTAGESTTVALDVTDLP